MKDGIYFGMDDKDYHAVERLSSSGMQSIMVSPATFWVDSWMNPDKEERDTDTPARILGRAYHCARFEPHLFELNYCRDLEKDDLPDALKTATEIGAALADAGQAKTKAGESVQDKAHRLLDTGYEGQIWHVERALFEQNLAGRTPLAGHIWGALVEDMRRIHDNPEILEKMSGGQSEVAIFYTCPESGIEMKSKIDFLAHDRFVDFKTFENSMRKELHQCIIDAIKYNRYFVQFVAYWQAVELVRTGVVDIAPGQDVSDEQKELIDNIRARENPLECWYIFQEKKGVPNLLAYKMPSVTVHKSHEVSLLGATKEGAEKAKQALSSKSALFRKGEVSIQHAKIQFLRCMEIYGVNPWFTPKPLRDVSDMDFPPWWLEKEDV